MSAVLNYQLIEKLGSGGMGQIYKAQDTRLNRFVAIKILPPDQAGDPERQRRFVQEAQAASALNHPNIVTIHNIINEGDTLYIVMEYIVGKTLLEIILEGGLRVPQVLRCAAQMADALGAAHAAGIVHRDLKPANVMVTESGLVKVLDFGLAKWTGQAAPMGTSGAAAATASMGYSADETILMESPLTVEGSILGTLNYMAPEQAEGKRVDSRADIFSFGAVLYEMATGRRAFEGGSAVATLSAVLRDEVTPIAVLAPDVPRELEEIVGRCLRKAPQERWQSMREVEVALNNLRRKPDLGIPQTSHVTQPAVVQPDANAARNPRKRLMYRGAGVALLAAALVSGWWWASSRQATRKPSATPASTAATPSASATPGSVLTNENIIEMFATKVPISAILEQIRSSKTNFDLSTDRLIEITTAGVPATVIEAMRNPKSAPATDTGTAQPALNLPPRASPSTVPPPAGTNSSATAEGATAALATAPENKPTLQLVSVKLNDALPFRILLIEDVPTDAPEHQPVSFRVADGFEVGDTTVIAQGATVTGEVMGEVAKKKFLGIGGNNKMSFRLLFADSVENEKIRIRATPSVKEDGPASRPFDTGKGSRPKDIAAARGTEYIAYIDGEQTVSIHK
jgi:serine/threonine protein kinase